MSIRSVAHIIRATRVLYTSYRFIHSWGWRGRGGRAHALQARGKTIRTFGVSFIASQDLPSSVGEIDGASEHRKTGLLPRDPDKLPRGGGIHLQDAARRREKPSEILESICIKTASTILRSERTTVEYLSGILILNIYSSF